MCKKQEVHMFRHAPRSKSVTIFKYTQVRIFFLQNCFRSLQHETDVNWEEISVQV